MASRAFPRLLLRLLLAIGAILVILAIAAWTLIANPPELLRIGAAYAAKTVCSNVFVAGRDSAGVLAHDVQAPGHPILCLLYTSPSPRDRQKSRMPSSA